MFEAVITVLSLIVIFGAGWLCWRALQVIERLGMRAIDKMRGILPEDRALRSEEKLLDREKRKLTQAEQTKVLREEITTQRKAIEAGASPFAVAVQGWASVIWLAFIIFLVFKLVGHLDASEKRMDAIWQSSGYYGSGQQNQ